MTLKSLATENVRIRKIQGNMMHNSHNNKIPQWLIYKEKVNETSPIWFIDVRGTDFTPESPLWQEKINSEILSLLGEMEEPEPLKEPVLIKCHIG